MQETNSSEPFKVTVQAYRRYKKVTCQSPRPSAEFAAHYSALPPDCFQVCQLTCWSCFLSGVHWAQVHWKETIHQNTKKMENTDLSTQEFKYFKLILFSEGKCEPQLVELSLQSIRRAGCEVSPEWWHSTVASSPRRWTENVKSDSGDRLNLDNCLFTSKHVGATSWLLSRTHLVFQTAVQEGSNSEAW